MEAHNIPMLHPQVAARVVDGQALIVLADAGEVVVLNEAATHVWQWIDGRHSVGEIVTEMSLTYGLDIAQAASDTDQFLQTLFAANAVKWSEMA